MVTPSVNEQHNPLPDASLSNQPFNSGWLGSWASAGTTKIAKNIPRSILGARFSSIIVPPSPDTIQAQAANKGKEEDLGLIHIWEMNDTKCAKFRIIIFSLFRVGTILIGRSGRVHVRAGHPAPCEAHASVHLIHV